MLGQTNCSWTTWVAARVYGAAYPGGGLCPAGTYAAGIEASTYYANYTHRLYCCQP